MTIHWQDLQFDLHEAVQRARFAQERASLGLIDTLPVTATSDPVYHAQLCTALAGGGAYGLAATGYPWDVYGHCRITPASAGAIDYGSLHEVRSALETERLATVTHILGAATPARPASSQPTKRAPKSRRPQK